ncbi:MAG: pyridoxamine 5'-phosphate oxidase family protein [Deltaproteobacteria bacterium]
MKLSEYLSTGGSGVIATADKDGTINTAVYAVPHFVDEETVAWGMTDGRTFRNLQENPNAAFLHQAPGDGAAGVRMTLKLEQIEESGRMLDAIRARARTVSGAAAADMVRFVAFFKVVETRPLM